MVAALSGGVGKATRLGIVVAAMLAAVGSSSAGAAECPGEGTEVVQVVAAAAGNALTLSDGTVVRLAGVAVPQAALSEDGVSPWDETARQALEELVAGDQVRLAWVADKADRHGRRVARIVLPDGRWLEAAMVEDGWVQAQWLPGEEACFADLLPFEAVARALPAGLWADPAHAVVSADDPSLRSRNGLYELVEGRVVSVGRGTRMIFLDFGPDVRHDFTVMVPLGVSDAMAADGISPDSLAGRRVRVRGIVEDSGGPAIRLNDRSEIELID